MKICAKCFKDYALRTFIEENGVVGVCELSGELTKVIDTIDLSDSFDELLSSFSPTPQGRPFYEIIQQDWGVFDEKYGADILKSLLEERKSPLSIDTPVGYADDVISSKSDWERIKYNLLHKFRFLTIKELESAPYYNSAFSIHTVEFNKGDVLYRSRINARDQEIPYNKTEMGAPPIDFASAGRANPQGIPFLYLCDDIETTFYEVKALFLDVISTGVFLSNRSLKIVDFTKKGSPFDSKYSNVKIGIVSELILKEISKDLSRPMRRGDTNFEYIPTQFICEYIKFSNKVDGIAFKSSLHIGTNYVFFNPKDFECQDDVQIHRINKVTIEENI